MEVEFVSSDSAMLCSKDVELKVNSEEAVNKKSHENKLQNHLHELRLTKTKFALNYQSLKEKYQLMQINNLLLSQTIKEKKQVMHKKFALISQSLNAKNQLMSERQQRVLARVKAWKKKCLSVTDSNVKSKKIASESRQASKICGLRDILKKKIQCARLKVQKEHEAKKIIKDRLVQQCAGIKASKEEEAKKIIQGRLVQQCAGIKASKEQEAKKIIQDRLAQCARVKASKEQQAKKIVQDRLWQCARMKEQKEREAKKTNLSKSKKDTVKLNDMENDFSSLKVPEDQPCSSKMTQPTTFLINNTQHFLLVRLQPSQKGLYELVPVEKIKDVNDASQPSQLPAVNVNTEPLDSETSCQTLELVFEQDQPEKDQLLTYIKEEINPLFIGTQDDEQSYPVKVKVEPMDSE